MKKSIKKQLRIIFTGVAVVPMVLTGIIISWISFNSRLELAKRFQMELGRSTSIKIGHFLTDSASSHLEAGLYYRDLERLSRPKQSEYLARLITHNDHVYGHMFHNMALFDCREGMLVCEYIP